MEALPWIAGAGVLLGAITSVVSLFNASRAARTAAKVQEISVNVDGRLSTLIERQAELLGTLHEAGVPIPPPPPSVPAP
jgi:hypothetical protein